MSLILPIMNFRSAAEVALANKNDILGLKVVHYSRPDWTPVDRAGRKPGAARKLECERTVRAGRIVYDLNGSVNPYLRPIRQ